MLKNPIVIGATMNGVIGKTPITKKISVISAAKILTWRQRLTIRFAIVARSNPLQSQSKISCIDIEKYLIDFPRPNGPPEISLAQ
jgi:hypothetical protein